MAQVWNNAELDEMRKVGDPLADHVVGLLFETSGVYAVNDLMKTLIQNDYPTPEQLPAQLEEYLKETSQIAHLESRYAEQGQRLFERAGPEILIVLLCYSLPACYADRKGVQVLYRTGYLNNRANRRVFETARMVMGVLTPGGLDPTGRGVRAAQKVRLMHAAIRWLILNNPEVPWDQELGFPINQEDLAVTLLTFSHVIIDGLGRLGLRTTPLEQEAYLETWKVIGRIMGIQEALIPEDTAAAKTLYETILERQAQPSPEGKAMVHALLDTVNKYGIPGAALMRHFLPAEMADGFEIPKHRFEDWLVKSASDFRKQLEPIAGQLDRSFWLTRKFSLLLIQGLVSAEIVANRAPFVIPTNLNYEWHRAHRPSLWQQLSR